MPKIKILYVLFFAVLRELHALLPGLRYSGDFGICCGPENIGSWIAFLDAAGVRTLLITVAKCVPEFSILVVWKERNKTM